MNHSKNAACFTGTYPASRAAPGIRMARAKGGFEAGTRPALASFLLFAMLLGGVSNAVEYLGGCTYLSGSQTYLTQCSVYASDECAYLPGNCWWDGSSCRPGGFQSIYCNYYGTQAACTSGEAHPGMTCAWNQATGACTSYVGQSCQNDYSTGTVTCCVDSAPFCDTLPNINQNLVCLNCISVGDEQMNPNFPYNPSQHGCSTTEPPYSVAPCCDGAVCCTDPSVCQYTNRCRACGTPANGLGCSDDSYCCNGFFCSNGACIPGTDIVLDQCVAMTVHSGDGWAPRN